MTLPPPRFSRRARGFTLVELVMILIILGILAIFAMPRLDKNIFEQRAFHDQFKAALQYARKAAVAQRRYVCVTLSGGNAVFTVDTRTPEATAAHCNGTNELDLTLPVADARCGSATNRICPPDGIALAGPASLAFTPAGGATASASYAITGQPAITVEAQSGYVH